MTTPPPRPRVFRDPVHGDIVFPAGRLSALLERVIDTELFQRLRGIRQTAVMNLVFHGAEHSRFVHSMGAAHVAGLMIEAAARNSGQAISDAERDDVILAALLHDVGHGPFSHSLEDIVGSGFTHERMSVRILTESESEIHRLLAADDSDLPRRLAAFIEHGSDHAAGAEAPSPASFGPPASQAWARTIVSSQLDADRLDYLARDALMAGIRTHAFDLGRLVRSLLVIDHRLVVDARAQDVVEAFLLALDQMYGTAYYHKTVRAASLLLEATIRRALELARHAPSAEAAWQLFPRRGGRADPFYMLLVEGDRIPLGDFVRLDEAHVMALFAEWSQSEDATLRDLVTSFRTRRFPKMVRLRVEPTSLSRDDWEATRAQATAIFRRRFPERDPGYYVHFDEPERLSYRRYALGSGADPILVTAPGGQNPPIVRPIEADPRSIANNLSTRLYVPRLFVPAEIRDEVEQALSSQSSSRGA